MTQETREQPNSTIDSTPEWPEIDWVNPSANLKPLPMDGWYQSIKPSWDFIAGIFLTIAMIPFVILGWLIVKISSVGPGFYWQTRLGRDRKPYPIFKLRSMRHNIEKESGPQWATSNDNRVFAAGKFLRKTHLDEIPQLLNVLRGEMSLVGPRPERPEVIQMKSLEAQVPAYSMRTLVHPGVTGLAQVQLPADSDIISVRHKVYYDVYYIMNQSLWLDIRIVMATLFKMFGLSPNWLRRLFFLPTRDQVVDQFLALLHPQTEGDSCTQLEPVASAGA